MIDYIKGKDYLYKECVTILHETACYSLPSRLQEFISLLNDASAKVPTEYQSDIQIEISSETEYDSSNAILEVYYYRSPTEPEVEARKARAKSEAEQRIKWAETTIALAKKYLGS